MTDTAKLRDLAQRATQGEWEVCLGSGHNVFTGIHAYQNDGNKPIFIADCLTDYMLSKEVRCEDDHRHNLKYIAACSPATILELLDRLEAAERVCECVLEEKAFRDIISAGCGQVCEAIIRQESTRQALSVWQKVKEAQK